MLFPSSVLCNDAGQAVLRQKVRSAINQLNRDWNFCSYAVDGNFHSLNCLRNPFFFGFYNLLMFFNHLKVLANAKNWISM